MTNAFMRNNLISIVGAILLTSLSYGLGIRFSWINEISALEAFSVFTSYWCTFLCVFQTRFNYIIAAISVAALGFLFYNQNLLASMALQIYLFPTLLYGWFRWRADEITRPVSSVGFDLWLVPYAAVVLVTYALGVLINNAFGGSNTWIDTSIFVASILAQFMLDNKKLENWIVWFLVDVISVGLYWNQGLKILAIQMGLFALNAVWGYWEWRKSKQANLPEPDRYQFEVNNIGRKIGL